ncbi:proteinaceous RNase P 1, chloroplastic/mitochondrial isoform X3 [Daucus carota subsp. sativus]|uniref:proteinaceous RNase P 1, chloroplastic/mitochondrial isoform X3 n=1 Tax=Daucus carota subsp. sativus TaxID=79200 RepID=UPI0007EFB6D6|nr:PREDICTED: proteinaceous RNase P 1, chloroplastic/mitochondrial-like isoform X3 [Daucus carota subsp. sativus]
MALFSLKPLQQHHHTQFLSCYMCKFALHSFNLNYSCVNLSFTPTKHTLRRKISPFLQVKAHVTHLKETNDTEQNHSDNGDVFSSGVASFRHRDKRVEKETMKNEFSNEMREQKGGVLRIKDRYVRNKGSGSERKKDMGHGLKSNVPKNRKNSRVKGEDVVSSCKEGDGDKVGVVEKKGRRSKKTKEDSQEGMLKIGLDMCSKRGDVIGAIQLFDLAQRDGIQLGQYHYAVILYLCSSATTGIVQPAKSGKSSRSLSSVDVPISSPGELSEVEEDNSRGEIMNDGLGCVFVGKGKSNGSVDLRPQTLDELFHLIKNDVGFTNVKYVSGGQKDYQIQVSEDVQGYARERGFEIYKKMLSEQVPMNEATLTSVARMAMSMGNGEMAFDIIKQMQALGINPKLRSYGPALSVFTNNGDIENAFIVEKHMLEHGVYPEEPELEALLRVSIEAGSADKVYYLLHKLRTSVRKVSPNTACLIESWFCSKVAAKVGKRKWDPKLVEEAIANGGGGWHGQGWLGNGKWLVSRTSIGADGLCKCCGEKLVTIDLDPTETETFAESVASIAREREKNANFERFQKWLDYYGPFEAVVDAANVGLYSQRNFKPSKVNAIVNGIRQMLPSKKWPLIVLHNRRINGHKMDEPFNKALIEKWKHADALYLTPTGSNDDWYWLYAAIKFKGLLVTNDEMRDHLFQLLGNDFFPKWKERHQVRFTFSDIGPVFHMPPPCSVVIQESANGFWHVPLVSESDSEMERTWLCVTRAKSQTKQNLATKQQDSPRPRRKREDASSESLMKAQVKLPPFKHGNHQSD